MDRSLVATEQVTLRQPGDVEESMFAPGEAPKGDSPYKGDSAFVAIRQRIADGTYEPGRRLVLDQLARELSVSTVPVREALRRLEAKGYVEFERNVGARVARMDPAQYVSTVRLVSLLEAYALAEAAPHISAATLAEARGINARMQSVADGDFDPVEFAALNRELHLALLKHCPDEHLLSLVQREWDRLDAIRRSGFIYIPQRGWVSIVEEHATLLDMIEAKVDAARIERLVRAHKLHSLKALSASVKLPGARKLKGRETAR